MLKMFPKIKSSWVYFFIGLIFVIFIDQISKFYISKYFPEIIFRSFGLWGHFGLYWEGLFIILIIIFFLLFKKIFIRKEITGLLFGTVIGAALSNIFDKLIRSEIIDWIPIFNFRFNLADLVLIICGGALIYYLWKRK